jgi:hypothetical protein
MMTLLTLMFLQVFKASKPSSRMNPKVNQFYQSLKLMFGFFSETRLWSLRGP